MNAAGSSTDGTKGNKCLRMLLPIPAYIHPSQGGRVSLQLIQRKLYRTAGISCSRIDCFKAFQGYIQIGGYPRSDDKGTYPAGSMAYIFFHSISRDHPCFLMESSLVFGIVYPGISGSNDQNRLILQQKGHGLCDLSGPASDGLCGQLYCSTGTVQFLNLTFKSGIYTVYKKLSLCS